MKFFEIKMLKDFEDQYIDVLQNIEWGLLSLVVDHPDLCDHDLLRIIEYTLTYYKSVQRGTSSITQNTFTGIHREIFEQVLSICDFRLKPAKENHIDSITTEELLLCLKRIEKSIKFWTKEGGRKGYINFVMPRVCVE